MDIQDNTDKESILVHLAQMLEYRDEMVILSVTGKSVETRLSAAMEAMETGQHIWEDLVLLVESAKMVEPVKLDKDFQMWADQLNTDI